jgi:hypothetical protein
MNAPTYEEATEAMLLGGGRFAIANQKDGQGGWNWRTFGSGAGFVADAFIGGLLKGGKVHFNLTNGTLLIGDNIENYSLLFDGQNLKIKLGERPLDEQLADLETNMIYPSDTEPETPAEGHLWLNTADEPNSLFVYQDGEWVYIGTDLSVLEGNINDIYNNLGSISDDLSSKADQSALDQLAGDVDDRLAGIDGKLDGKADVGVLQAMDDAYRQRLDDITIDAANTETELANLINSVASMAVDLGNTTAVWDFIRTRITMGDAGLFISSVEGGDVTQDTGILISSGKISFIDSGKEVAFIEGQIMQISHGIFVESATIGKHKLETIPGTGISVFSYVGGES